VRGEIWRPRPRQGRPDRRWRMGSHGWRRHAEIRFQRPLRRLEHVGRHAVSRRCAIRWRIRWRIGRRCAIRRGIGRRRAAVGRRSVRRRRARQRADRRIVRAAIRRWSHHADSAIGGRPRDNAIDRPNRAGARIDNDAHENAAIIGGADHIGRAFPPRPGQRLVTGRPHDLVDLIRRHETGQRSCGRGRWREGR